MIKMIIKMDNDKINASPEYSTDRVYSALDRIFFQRGMERFDTDYTEENTMPKFLLNTRR